MTLTSNMEKETTAKNATKLYTSPHKKQRQSINQSINQFINQSSKSYNSTRTFLGLRLSILSERL